MIRIVPDRKKYRRALVDAGTRAEFFHDMSRDFMPSLPDGFFRGGVPYETFLRPLAMALWNASESKYSEPRPWEDATAAEQRECMMLALAAGQFIKTLPRSPQA